MVQWTDFTIQQIQLSAWTGVEEIRPASVLRFALREWGEVYDAEPISVPLPGQAPGELPGIVLLDRDRSRSMEIARERVNLVVARFEGRAALSLAALLPVMSDRLIQIFEYADVPIARLAAVLTRHARVDEPGQVLARHFCRDRWLRGPLHRPEGFEIHAHKVYSPFNDIPMNSWIRARSAPIGAPVHQFILVEQDLNSLSEERSSRRFASDEVRGMFDTIAGESDSILRSYFPEELEGDGGPDANRA